MKRRRSLRRRRRWARIIIYALLIGLALVFAFPFVWMLVTSLKFRSEHNEYPFHFLPRIPQWINYVRALTWIDFAKYLRNSLIISGISVSLFTLSSALVGYGFARLRAPGRNALFILVLSTMMLPYMVTIIPTYIMFHRLGLVNTYWLWVFWGLAGSPFNIFLYRQFFANIPKELEEAATLDGCNWFQTFYRIFLPLSKPAIAAVAIFVFQWAWGDFITPSMFLTDERTTLTIKLALGYTDPVGNGYPPVQCAAALFYTLPVIALFFMAQKQIIQGVVTTGLKA
ncbi:MAG: carbohydrate ABC transporter permease [Patescibacteria group bacterium]